MRPHPFDRREPVRTLYDPEPAGAEMVTDDWGHALPPGPEPRAPTRWGRWVVRGLALAVVLFVVAVGWLAVTAPLSKSLRPPTPPSITLTAFDGAPIARRGAIIGAPVDASKLPPHVWQAFVAIEDRRFFDHWGVDPRGIGRAAWHNLGSGGVREGGSTITQQLAKNAFLDSDRTAARKLREVLIAFWLEARLSKNEILSRYLSNVYFGDNVYGLTAAARHYFGRTPAQMNVGQAAMLAGLVKAPSRLAPTGNLKGARARQAVVVGAMEAAGYLTHAQAEAVQPQRVLPLKPQAVPTGTYFADWVLPEAREQAGEVSSEATVRTTLDRRLQREAERVVRQAGLRQAQAAVVAMRRDGQVVTMVGGRDYRRSPFNRATQAKRQPGSTFKLFVYLAALRAGLTPDSVVDDSPVEIAGWKPRNDDGRYLGPITLKRAFARSSNVAAARLTQQVGVRSVIKAARDLGISTPIANEATIGLGTSEVTLLELTAAFAAVADGRYPVSPHGVEGEDRSGGWYQQLVGGRRDLGSNVHDEMLELLNSSLRGTGREAELSVPAYGKTGTSQSGRDAWFIGFSGDLVVGVWVGNDDNTPNPGLHGGGVPAQIWRNFMVAALGVTPLEREPVVENAVDPDELGNAAEDVFGDAIDAVAPAVDRAQDGLDRLGIDLGADRGGDREDQEDRRRDEPPPEDRGPPPDEEQ